MRPQIPLRSMVSCCLIIGSVVLQIGAVDASEALFNRSVSEKWHLQLGGFSQSADLSISAGPRGEEPDVVDLNSLGADKNDQAGWISSRWRVNTRWHVGLSFVEVDRKGFASAEDNFVFGEPPDEVDVTIGATVNSSFNTKYYIVQGGYNLYKNRRSNFGIGAGLHVMEMAASLSAEVTADGETTNLGTGSSHATAPLPNIYLYGDYAFTPSIAATGSIGWFGLKIDNYDGELVSLNANLEYRPWQHIGVGIGYTLVDVDVTVDETDSVLNFSVNASGPRLYLIASFGTVQ